MGFNIVTEYPWWFLGFCILAGALYAFVLYYKDKKLDETSKALKNLLTGLRFLCVTIITFLLLSPLIRNITRQVEKPVIIIAQDNSESIGLGKDSSFYRNEYRENFQKIVSKLEDKYEVRAYSFGDNLKEQIDFSFKEKQTDISELIEEINTRYSNRNVGAIILASDGLYNKGKNPLYTKLDINAPVYTIALGDTIVKKDIILTKVVHNRFAYLGNTFPLEIIIDAKQLRGKGTTVKVSKGTEILFTKTVDFTSSSFNTTIPVQLEAKEKGLQRYRISLSSLTEETNFNNNTQDIFIEVLDGRQKILIVTNAPHPDIGAFKNSVEDNDNYETEIVLADKFTQSIEKYNLIVLHQLPSLNNNFPRINELMKSDKPVLFILGAQTQFNLFNNLNAGLNISGIKSKLNDVLPVFEKGFSLFTLSDHTIKSFAKFPPLQVPFGTFRSNTGANILLTQRIGIVNTNDPLIVFNQNEEKKTAVIAGEGIWKWRLHDYMEHGNHDAFNELMSKTVQFLSLKLDKSLFRVISKNNFYENEAITFDAELYNESYELINEPEVNVVITNSENKKFPFTFSKTTNSYRLNAGNFPVGEYRYEATVKSGAKTLTDKGEFSVTALQIESSNSVADHQLLYAMAKKTGGDLIYPDQLEQLLQTLESREDIKSISYTHKQLNEVINLKWIFFLILFLLSLEWFIRKRTGAY